jgi:hypothetical protein
MKYSQFEAYRPELTTKLAQFKHNCSAISRVFSLSLNGERAGVRDGNINAATVKLEPPWTAPLDFLFYLVAAAAISHPFFDG